MKNKIILICLSATCVFAGVESFAANPEAKLTVRVLDERLQPVENATVRIGFSETSSGPETPAIGLTDVNGQFSAGGPSPLRLAADVRDGGFYLSGTPFVDFTNVEAGHWQPWNLTEEVILRPIGKPIALYAKIIETKIPVADKPCGYDLEVGDWTMPYGKGLKKDFIFTIHQDYRGIQNYDLEGDLAFASPLDGLQETSIPDVGKNSAFKWERHAPERGYQPKFAIQNSWYPQGKLARSFKSPDEWQGYFFRVRTVEQDGKIVSAHYGKIRGGIYVYPDRKGDKPEIVFTYYFNPTPNDRNLEWDTTKNLFGKLPFMESPREP